MTHEEAIVKLAHAVATTAAQAGALSAVKEAHDVVRALTPEPPPEAVVPTLPPPPEAASEDL